MLLAPDRVEEFGEADSVSPPQQQCRQDGPLLWRADVQFLFTAPGPDRSQDGETYGNFVAAHAPDCT